LDTQRIPYSLEPLDRRFVPSKPVNTAEDELFYWLEQQGRARLTLKRNGYGVNAVLTKQGVRLYSRTGKNISDKFPAVIAELGLTGFAGRDTHLSGELFVQKQYGKDDYAAFTEVIKSDIAGAISLQQKYIVRLMLYNVITIDGLDVTQLTHDDRFSIIHTNIPPNLKHILPVEILNMSFDVAQALVIQHNHEGLVIYDGWGVSGYALHGDHKRTPRPNTSWKWKPEKEDDFFVRNYTISSAPRNLGLVKDLCLLQIHGETGEIVDCGKTSSGLTVEDRKTLLDKELYPLVLQVVFHGRFEAGTLVNARIFQIRAPNEKSWQECVYHPTAKLKPFLGQLSEKRGSRIQR